MGQALYRKYRSKKLSEIVGQEHITTTLDNALKQGRISHAYLFTGPRGIGKTSIARILAHEVNGLPYDETATHLDIIEIDAASNRRIDEIRELRERVHTAPASAKFKVYIIDEVHMLTKEAFNALLKTLEEPPAHAIFILATTEVHKLPETIISRTQRFTFKPVEEDQVVKHLAEIAQKEKIAISNSALKLIAQHGGGSFRDSISLLDQAGNSGKQVELEDVQRVLGIAPDQAISDLIAVLQAGSTAQLVELLSRFRDQGYQPAQLAKQLASNLRNQLIAGSTPFDVTTVRQLLRGLLEVPAAHDPGATLELLLIDLVLDRAVPQVMTIEAAAEPAPKPDAERATSPKQKARKEVTESVPTEKMSPVKAVSAPTISGPLTPDIWLSALNEIKKTHNTLYGIARMAQPKIEGDTLTLCFKFPFHQKRINEAKNKQLINDVITAMTGSNITIVCIIDKDADTIVIDTPQAEAKAEQPQAGDTVSTISNIFGGAEILE